MQTGVTVRPNGDIIVVNGAPPKKFYTYSGSSWNSGILLDNRILYPSSIGAKPNGDLVVVDVGTNKIYTYNYSNSSWSNDTIPVPDIELSTLTTGIVGIAVKANGDFVAIGLKTNRLYTYSIVDGTWDSGLPMPIGGVNNAVEEHGGQFYRVLTFFTDQEDAVITVDLHGFPAGAGGTVTSNPMLILRRFLLESGFEDADFDITQMDIVEQQLNALGIRMALWVTDREELVREVLDNFARSTNVVLYLSKEGKISATIPEPGRVANAAADIDEKYDSTW